MTDLDDTHEDQWANSVVNVTRGHFVQPIPRAVRGGFALQHPLS